MSRDLKKIRAIYISRRGTFKGNERCEGSNTRACLVCSGNSKETSLWLNGSEQGGEIKEMEISEVVRGHL